MIRLTLQFRHVRGNRPVLFCGLVFLLCGNARCLVVQGQVPTSAHAVHAVHASEKWKLHEKLAQEYLRKASECMARNLEFRKRSCDPNPLLGKASDEYSKLQSFLSGGVGTTTEAAMVAYGFIRSGQPARTIGFLLERPERTRDSNLAHLLADAFFGLGDYKNTALAYKAWIDTGCNGYLDSMQDQAPWLVPANSESCSALPQALRSRLEMLQLENGEPSNLPSYNTPPGRLTVH